MNEISHAKARQWVQKAADALLTDQEAALLTAHLAGCASCRAYQKEMKELQFSIRSSLHRRAAMHANRAPQRARASQSTQLTQQLRRTIRMRTVQKFSFALIGFLVLAILVFGSVYLARQTLPTPTVAALPTQDVPPTQHPPGEENVTITFAAHPAEESVYQPLIEAFHQEHPNIIVQFVERDPTAQMDARAQASLADVSFLDGRSGVIAGAGYFRELTPLMETDPNFHPDDFWPGALTGCEDREGRSYGVPISLYALGILYDPQALDADGLPHPKPGWTWEEFRQTVNAMSSGDTLSRRFPFVDQPVSADNVSFINLLAPIIDDYLASNNGMVDATSLSQSLQWYFDLVQEERIFPVTEFEQSEAYKELFKDGVPAMWIGTANSWIEDGPALNQYDMAPYPIDSRAPGIPTSPILTQCGVISAGSNHPQEAWLWLNYLSHQWIHGDERLVYINQAVPARPSVADNNPFWENIPANAQETYRFGLEHGWYGSAYPEHLWAVIQAVIETSNRGSPLANALESTLANMETESNPVMPDGPVVVATPRPQSAETITIRFYTEQVFQSAEKYGRLVEGFNRDHPEIQVEIPSSWNPADFPESGDDTFYFPAEKYDCFELNLPDLSMKDVSAILDVNTWLDQDATLRADFFPGQLDAYTVDGRVYGLPASLSPNLMFYNKTLLDRLGIALPGNDWSFDEFIQMATAASTTLDGQKTYGFAPYAWRDVGFLLAGRGVEWITMGGAFPQAHFTNPSMEDTYRWINSLRQSGVLLPTTSGDGSEVIQNALSASQLAFWTAESTPWGGWYFNPMETMPYEIGAAPLPNTPVLNSANNPGMTGLFISSKSQNPQACWTWIRYLSGQPDAFPGVPARRSVAASPAWEAIVSAEKATIYRAALEQADGALRPTSWENQIVNSIFYFSSRALQEVFTGSEAGVALATAQRKADFVPQCLEQANYLNLPARDREGVVDACFEQVNSVH